jgi:hypothetical protein
MTTIDNSQRTAAKIAGVAGLPAFGLVVFANYVLLKPFIVPRNAADTARNILAYQTQFRVALTCFIAYPSAFVFSHFSQLQQDRKRLRVRFADGSFQINPQLLAPV